ncbi:peptidyl-prolyl cis-trans isomerase [Achromobacter xylosoxidans]
MPLAQLTPEMRPVVEQLKTGDVSAPVQSAAGFHILKLADLRPASVTPFDQVKGELRAALRSQRQELAARAYLEGLLNAGTVSIDGAALNAAFEQTAPPRRPAAPSRAPSPEAPEPVPALARRLDGRLLQALGQADPPVSVQSAAALIQALRATFSDEMRRWFPLVPEAEPGRARRRRARPAWTADLRVLYRALRVAWLAELVFGERELAHRWLC